FRRPTATTPNSASSTSAATTSRPPRNIATYKPTLGLPSSSMTSRRWILGVHGCSRFAGRRRLSQLAARAFARDSAKLSSASGRTRSTASALNEPVGDLARHDHRLPAELSALALYYGNRIAENQKRSPPHPQGSAQSPEVRRLTGLPHVRRPLGAH